MSERFLWHVIYRYLLHNRDIFIRELISNANDAVEKFRLTALTDRDMWNGDPLNITIKAVKDEDGKGGHIIITGMVFIASQFIRANACTDSGIGMSAEELTNNLVCIFSYYCSFSSS